VIVEAGDVAGLAAAIDRVVLEMSPQERQRLESQGREYAMSFDRGRVFDTLFPGAATDVRGANCA
jgi:hypothetical protein